MSEPLGAGSQLRVADLSGYSGPPTIVFLGAATAGSRIHSVFPSWAPIVARGTVLRGLDMPEDAAPACFREAVDAMTGNRSIIGAVVTTHKLRLYGACRDLIAAGDPFVALARELNCVDFRERPIGYARDAVSLHALLFDDAVAGVPVGGGSIVCIGAGGSATALLLAVGLDVNATLERGTPQVPAAPRPTLTIVGRTERSIEVIDEVRSRCGISSDSVRLVAAAKREATDAIVRAAPPGSLVINATGLGKTAPGSPLSGPVAFPPGAVAWDFNYRGPLTFLSQARSAGLRSIDGWQYFVAGWTAALAAIARLPFTPNLLSATADCRVPE